MKRLMISRGGQISIPAAIRKRWGTRAVTLDDRGDHVVVRPAPENPIEAVRGILADYNLPPSEELRRRAREDERRAEERKWGRYSTRTR